MDQSHLQGQSTSHAVAHHRTSWCVARPFRAVVLFGVCCVSDLRAEQSGNVESLPIADLVVAVTDLLTNIDSLYCEYTIKYGNQPGSNVVRCRSARAGERWHHAEIRFDAEREADAETVRCFNGEKVFALLNWTNSDGQKKWGNVELQDPYRHGNLDPEYMLGTKLSNIDRSIVEVLTSFPTERLPAEKPADTALISLSSTNVTSIRPDVGAITFSVRTDLDPAHDLLPREILIATTDAHSAPPDWSLHWKVQDYKQVVDHKTGTPRWFPASGSFEQGKKVPPIYMTVDVVTINEPLDDSLFDPTIPDGTTIADQTSGGGGRITVKGGMRRIDHEMGDLTDKAKRAVSHTNRWLLIGNALVVLALMLVLLLRRRNRSS